MDGFSMVLIGVAALALAAATGLGGFVLAARATNDEHLIKQLEARLAEEREADRRHYAKAGEELLGIAEAVRRRQNALNGGKGGRPAADEEEPKQLSPEEQRAEIVRRDRARRGLRSA